MIKKRINIKTVILFVSLFVLFGLRIINLDADIPAWGMVNYQPMDEGQYATMALNKINSGSFRLDVDEEINFMTSAHIRNNIIGNLSVYLGLKLFGDNYYGLRISSVIFGLLNIILFAFILKNLQKKYEIENYNNINTRLIFISIGLLLVDFVYMIACRTVETSIYRMFFIQLILYVFTINMKSDLYQKKIRFLFIGFLSVFSIFAVYITNIFVILATIIMIIFYGVFNGRNAFFNAAISFIAGAGVAYIICDLYYNIVWGTSCIVNTMQIISDFSGTSGYTGGNSFLAIIVLVLHFIAANSNVYNMAIFFICLLFLPIAIGSAIKKRNIDIVFIISLMVSLLLQTIINEDYIVRKYIMIYPLMFYMIYYVLISVSYQQMKLFFGKHRVFKLLYSITCIGVCAFVLIYRMFLIENDTYKDFVLSDKLIVLLQIAVIISLLITFLVLMYKKKCNNKICILVMAVLVIMSSIITNVYFDIKYVFTYKSHTEKEAMQAIGEQLGCEWVYGVYSISFTLYNDIKPVVNTYDTMGNDIEVLNANWYLDYCEYGFPEVVVGNNADRWREQYTYSRNFSTFGKKVDISIYKIEH